MELTAERAPVASMAEGAARGRAAVGLVLDGKGTGMLAADPEHAMAAANFLGYVMFTVQLANGLHPRSAVDFAAGEDRGSDLARGFLTAGTVEICCDYCGELMTAALAAAAAAQMRAVHGSQAASEWQALTFALTGPPF